MNKEQLYMVFDVESVGLQGLDFAVGFVVVNGYGVEVQHGLMACERNETFGTPASLAWCEKNIPKLEVTHSCPKDMREAFWAQWICWKDRGALLVADCAWPVEARFLIQCVDESPDEREWSGPYPLIDVGSVLMAHGKDPLQKFPRLDSELPEHNPLADARQSARVLIETLNDNRDSDYMELLYAVQSVHPNETRHETALRYIREREQSCCEAGGPPASKTA
jgi:hypothetical protein